MESVEHMISLFDTSRDEGYQEGKSEGKNEEKIENAKRFLAMGLSPEQVTEGTQLSLDEVKKLQN